MNSLHVLILCSSIGLVGCPGSSSAGGGSANAFEACKQSIRITCEKLAECRPVAFGISYPSVDECTRDLVSESTCEELTSRPNSGATAAAIDACGAAYRTASCETVFASGSEPVACDIRGKGANGAKCKDDTECTSGRCKKTNACGTCAEELPKTAGEACNVTDGCASGFACMGLKCVAHAKVGEACADPATSGSSDASKPSCARELDCRDGTCAAPRGEGEACDSKNSCDKNKELTCIADKCAKLALASAGEACGTVSGVATACRAGSWCKAESLTSGTCSSEFAKLGEACSDAKAAGSVSPCTKDLRCDSETKKCVARTSSSADAGSCQ